MAKKAVKSKQITIPGTKTKVPPWAIAAAGGGLLAAFFLMRGDPEAGAEGADGWLAEEVAQRMDQERQIFAGAIDQLSDRLDELSDRERLADPTLPILQPTPAPKKKKSKPKALPGPTTTGQPVQVIVEPVQVATDFDIARQEALARFLAFKQTSEEYRARLVEATQKDKITKPPEKSPTKAIPMTTLEKVRAAIAAPVPADYQPYQPYSSYLPKIAQSAPKKASASTPRVLRSGVQESASPSYKKPPKAKVEEEKFKLLSGLQRL